MVRDFSAVIEPRIAEQILTAEKLCPPHLLRLRGWWLELYCLFHQFWRTRREIIGIEAGAAGVNLATAAAAYIRVSLAALPGVLRHLHLRFWQNEYGADRNHQLVSRPRYPAIGPEHSMGSRIIGARNTPQSPISCCSRLRAPAVCNRRASFLRWKPAHAIAGLVGATPAIEEDDPSDPQSFPAVRQGHGHLLPPASTSVCVPITMSVRATPIRAHLSTHSRRSVALPGSWASSLTSRRAILARRHAEICSSRLTLQPACDVIELLRPSASRCADGPTIQRRVERALKPSPLLRRSREKKASWPIRNRVASALILFSTLQSAPSRWASKIALLRGVSVWRRRRTCY